MRVFSEELDKILGQRIGILDHGFIRVIDYMGNDSSIVQAARVSYGAGTKTTREDAGLINYLMRHRHTTPFEMCEIKFHLKMPIFVARQWIRHRMASVNELSARYSVVTDEFFVPDVSEICEQSKTNHQGRDKVIDSDVASGIRDDISNVSGAALSKYKEFLSNHNMTRELARGVLPQSMYTEMYWKIDLHNLIHFLSLRADSHAQKEIRVYALAMLDILKLWVPLTYDAFMNYKKDSLSFSKLELSKLKEMLNPEKVKQFCEENKDKKGELKEMCEKLLNILS